MEETANVQEPVVKPKRQLTEAQRLAFMKGREKRLANLAKKREEKLLKEDSISPIEALPLPSQEPAAEEKKVQPTITDSFETRSSKVEFDPDTMERFANLIADKVTVRPKPKRPYKKREPRVPVVVKEETHDSDEGDTAYPVPQRTYFWM